MFGIGQPEFIVILLIVLLLFGTSSLPKLSKTLGESASALRDGFTDGKNDKSLQEITTEVKDSAKEIKKHLIEVKQIASTDSEGYGEQSYGDNDVLTEEAANG